MAVDSSNPDAADCYRIVSVRAHFELDRSEQITTGLRGTSNLAIAISQPDNAIALLSREGTIVLDQTDDRTSASQT